ncbi:hypothetical protein [Paenibacillus phytorum]|nr:hypothetical protein [Paenibacillus phytorum]
MGKYKELKNVKVTSISYVHDPNAAKKWFDMCLDIMMQKLKEEDEEDVKE